MRLSIFIMSHMESILQAWEDFARTVELPREALTASGLRNHASFILKAVAHDMDMPQTVQQEIDKSQGLGPNFEGETAAETHAVLRHLDGFTLDQMVSEYRALRSSVLRLWMAQETSIDSPDRVKEIIRFNEAIDQAVVESIASYGKAVDTTRKMVLGVLGHDLRSPLTAIKMGAGVLTQVKQWGDRERSVAAQINDRADRANQLVNDLLDLARCNLGLGIAVQRQDTDLTSLCAAVVKEVSFAHPQLNVVFERTDPLPVSVDPLRMSQVLSNLIVNAIRHGDIKRPIRVGLSNAGEWAIIEVHNWGNPINADQMTSLFSPEARLTRSAQNEEDKPHGLGLGLFIAQEIAVSHAGKIEVTSNPELGTTFRVAFLRH